MNLSNKNLPAAAIDDDLTLWDAHDVAAYLKLSISWVRKASARGELPSLQIGGNSVRFDPAAIRAWAIGKHVAPARVLNLGAH